MGNHPIEGMMNVTIEKIKEMVDSSTVIGEPIKSPDGTILIPLSKISYGFVSGGSDFSGKKNSDRELFGGGGGAGVTVQPIAFVSISNGEVKMLQVEPYTDSTDRIISMLPELIDKVKSLFKKDAKKSKVSAEKEEIKREI